MADLIVKSAHIKYQSTVIQSQTVNYENLISLGHLLSEEARFVFKRVKQVTYRDSKNIVGGSKDRA